MNIKKYLKNIKPKNTYNPFSDYIKTSALMSCTPVSLYDDTIFCGASATGLTNPPKHHIFDRNLLHRLIANAKCYEDFLQYEQTVKAECPEVTLPIAYIYVDKIDQLRTGPIVYGLFIIQKLKKSLNKIYHK